MKGLIIVGFLLNSRIDCLGEEAWSMLLPLGVAFRLKQG